MLEYIYTSGYRDGDQSRLAPVAVYSNEVQADAVEEEKRSISTSLESGEQYGPTAIGKDVGQRLLSNVLIYAIAEKYDIEKLKEIAREKF